MAALTLQTFRPGAEEQTEQTEMVGMPKAAGKPAGDPKPANLNTARMDACCCRAPMTTSIFSGL